MRILHTSDWHLGRTFHGRVLDSAHEAFLDHLVELVDAESVHAIVVSGDVYDRAIPPADSVSLLDDALRRLADRTQVVLTSGNHDSARRLGFGSSLFQPSVAVRTRTAEVDRPVIIPAAEGGDGLYVYGLPYLEPDGARESLPPLLASRLGESGPSPAPVPSADGAAGSGPEAPGSAGSSEAEDRWLLPRSHEAVVSGALRLVAADLGRRRAGAASRVPALAMAHAFVVGGEASEDSERDIRVGGVDSVPAGVFASMGGAADLGGGLDYLALGHLHRPQEIGTGDGEPGAGPRLVYSGSPLPFSFPEADSAKSSVLLEIGPEAVTSLERIAAPLPYRAVTLRGSLEELLGAVGSGHESDWVRVELLGDLTPGAMARLKERFPEMLAFSHTPPEREGGADRAPITRASDPVEVAGRFLAEMLGHPAGAAELDEVRTAYEAARFAGKER